MSTKFIIVTEDGCFISKTRSARRLANRLRQSFWIFTPKGIFISYVEYKRFDEMFGPLYIRYKDKDFVGQDTYKVMRERAIEFAKSHRHEGRY